MTALARDLAAKRYGNSARPALIPLIPVAADTKIFAGALVGINSSGNALPAGASGVARIVGVAIAQADNTGGSAGDVKVRVERGAFLFTPDGSAPPRAQEVGATVYAVDDQTVTRSSSGTIAVGTFLGFEDTLAIVQVGV